MNNYYKYLNNIYILNENKDRFIDKNMNLSQEQKEEIKNYFASHANLESRFLNGSWNTTFTYEDFKTFRDSFDTDAKKQKKLSRELRKSSGLESLIEGEDYKIIDNNAEFTAYQPLSHKGARVIASNMVEPKLWCKSTIMTWTDKEVLPQGEPMKDGLYPGAKWCIAMETTTHWNNYKTSNNNFIIICSKNPNEQDNKKKVCLVLKRSGKLSLDESVLADDSRDTEFFGKYIPFIEKHFDSIEGIQTNQLSDMEKAYLECFGEDADLRYAEESYYGYFDSIADFARDFFYDIGGWNKYNASELSYYFDTYEMGKELYYELSDELKYSEDEDDIEELNRLEDLTFYEIGDEFLGKCKEDYKLLPDEYVAEYFDFHKYGLGLLDGLSGDFTMSNKYYFRVW